MAAGILLGFLIRQDLKLYSAVGETSNLLSSLSDAIVWALTPVTAH